MNMPRLLTVLASAIGPALGAYWYANGERWSVHAETTTAASAIERTPLYYRDPGGAPLWSAGPKKDDRGRDAESGPVGAAGDACRFRQFHGAAVLCESLKNGTAVRLAERAGRCEATALLIGGPVS